MIDSEDSRPPIDLTGGSALSGLPAPWRVEVVEDSASTNADVAARFREGEAEGLVLVAEHQTAGRGRMGREWVTPARSSLTVSFLLVPDGMGPERWPWLPLMTGIAAARAVRRVTGIGVDLKWPNDVLADGLKLGGILLERVESESVGNASAAAVVGIGINCTQSTEELPVPGATSLALATGGSVDRSALLVALVEELGRCYAGWSAGSDLRADYLELCVTPGQQVRVAVPGGEVIGEAVTVDEAGRLVVRTPTGLEPLGAGDVVHVRPEAD